VQPTKMNKNFNTNNNYHKETQSKNKVHKNYENKICTKATTM